MRKISFKKIYWVLAAAGTIMAGGFLTVYAATYYQVNYGATTTINEQGTCKRVTNNSGTGLAIFVPTNSSGEWEAFRTYPPSGVTLSSCETWYNGSWAYRKKITLDGTKIGSSESNFPFLVNLSSDSDLAARARSDGYDILFTDTDKTTKLNHEIEVYTSSTGALTAWVKIPSITSSTSKDIYMYYGYSSSSNQQNTSGGVWDSNYKAVWHSTTNDTTANNHDSTISGTISESTTAKVGKSADMTNDTTSYMSAADSADWDFGTGSFTISFWANFSALPAVNNAANIIMRGKTGGGYMIRFSNRNTSGTYNFSVYLGGTDYNSSGSLYNWSPSTGTWYYLTLLRDGTNLKVFNGETQLSSTQTSSTDITDSTVFNIGNSSESVKGNIDEVRVSNSARSTGYMGTSYKNQNSPSTFYSLAAQETY